MKSSNGWPASKDPKKIGIKSYKVEGTELKLRVAEAVAPLLMALAKEFHETIEPLDEGQLDDWGYAYRQIRGATDTLSNHASGTAIDLNASKHALGKSNTFSGENMGKCLILASKYGCKWGGTYQHRKDEMHFEIQENLEQVSARIERLGL